MSERIQKILAARGLGSRRHLENLISAGRVTVNGQVARLGDRLNPGDRVNLDGQSLRWIWQESQPQVHVLAYHKPVGEVCSRKDEAGRVTVFDRLPQLQNERWVNVGRLDLNTSGLLLFTNSGDLAQALLHPKQQIEREYLVRIHGAPSVTDLARLKEGIELDDGPARFFSLEPQSPSEPSSATSTNSSTNPSANQWFRVILREGRYREIRRLWLAVGCEVNRLIRVRFGPIHLDRQALPGQSYELSSSDIQSLYRAAGEASWGQSTKALTP